MGTYLMMLYVSLDQEIALKDFFMCRGWPYRKPDLATITEHVGPLTFEAVKQGRAILNIEKIAKRKKTTENVPSLKRAKTSNATVIQTASRIPTVQLFTVDSPSGREFKPFSAAEVIEKSAETKEQFAKSSATEDTVHDDDAQTIDIKIETLDPDYDQVEDEDVDDNDPTSANNGNVGFKDTQHDQDVSGSFGNVKNVDFSKDRGDHTGDGTSVMGAVGEEEHDGEKKPINLISTVDNIKIEILNEPLDGSVLEVTVESKNEDFASEPTVPLPSTSTPILEVKQKQTQISPKLLEHKCDKCAKVYQTSSGLKRHAKQHDSSLICRTCGRCFASQVALEQHKADRHAANLVCAICGKTFKTNQHLKAHTETHSDVKSFHCPFPNCNKQFVRNDNLRDHLNVHTGITLHTCPNCSKSFRSRSAYCHHKEFCTKHGTCKECKQEFRSRAGLDDHRASVHDNKIHPCPKCGKPFKWRSGLIRHKAKCAWYAANVDIPESLSQTPP